MLRTEGLVFGRTFGQKNVGMKPSLLRAIHSFHQYLGVVLEGVGDDSLIDHREGQITFFFKDQKLDLRLTIVLLNTASLDITTDANSSIGKLLLHLESL